MPQFQQKQTTPTGGFKPSEYVTCDLWMKQKKQPEHPKTAQGKATK